MNGAVPAFDVIIIGAGVVGCAIAREFTLQGAHVAVLDKAADILDGASKGNSAILHTGFDAPPGSLESACVARGHALYQQIHQSLGLPLMPSGALVLAWSESQEACLPALIDKARQNGVDDVALLSAAQLLRREPALASSVRAGFVVPREYLIDAWSAPHAYLLQALLNGAALERDCEVTGGRFDGKHWHLQTRKGVRQAVLVINAAGLFADVIDRRLTGDCGFRVQPRKGQFVVYDKPAAALTGHILLPVPGPRTKGVVVCRTAYGNLLVGPTAEEQQDRERAAVDRNTLRSLKAQGEVILPALANHEVTAVYAGLRPATQFPEYQINCHDQCNYVTVGGIRSTGLSAALGIAEYVYAQAQASLGPMTAVSDPVVPVVANISEGAERDWERAGHGGIVCHCESVTRREIERAMADALAPQTLAGLKRRTRVTMGRCQGYYCAAELASLTHSRLKQPANGLSDVTDSTNPATGHATHDV